MDSYPGLEFSPPKGAVDPNADDGIATVSWRRIDGRYTIVEFEGYPMESSAGESPDQELDRMATENKDGYGSV